jgi:hypothetical protein
MWNRQIVRDRKALAVTRDGGKGGLELLLSGCRISGVMKSFGDMVMAAPHCGGSNATESHSERWLRCQNFYIFYQI